MLGCWLLACSSSPDRPPRSATGGNTGAAARGETGGALSTGGASTSGGSGGAGGAKTGGATGASGGADGSLGGGAAPGATPDAGTGAGGTGGGATGGSAGGAAGAAPGGPPLGGGAVVTPVELPGSKPGIGFDDLKYSPTLKMLIVPAGRTGDVDLVDPQTLAITRLAGFSMSSMFTLGKHRSGSTSADDGAGLVFAIDNETKTVRAVDPATKMITSMATLAAAPDYVRWVEATREVWVTMPQNPGVSVPNPQIEVLKVSDNGVPTHSLNIAFAAPGPEGLTVDGSRHRAYTNNGQGGETYAVDVMTHAVVETWKNGCAGLTVDLELDEARGFLMVACSAGQLTVLDVAHAGKELGQITMVGKGVDVCGYNPTLHHMYLAGQDSMDLSIIGIPGSGKPVLLGSVATAKGAQMVAADDLGNAWVGDPGAGRLLKVRDTYALTP